MRILITTLIGIVCLYTLLKNEKNSTEVTSHSFYYSELNCEEEYIESRDIELMIFLKELAFLESSGNWKAINRFGYIGKYQFGGTALQSLNVYDNINYDTFINNPHVFPEALQDSLVVQLMYRNKSALSNYITKHKGQKINGILINDASVLAAAHLVGAGNMKKFFKSKGENIAKDGNNVKATHYMKKFEKFNFIL